VTFGERVAAGGLTQVNQRYPDTQRARRASHGFLQQNLSILAACLMSGVKAI
jgi:hypothetical protein